MAVDFKNRIDDTIEFECRVDDNIEIDLSTVMAVKVPLPIALQDKDIEPTTSEQVITADKGFSGLGTVSVGAVTSDIDENITARNIRGGVTILGVTGDLEPDKPDQSKVVEPSMSEQVITADSGYELASVTIKPVTAEIDSDIVAENIRKDTEILGVVGTMEAREDLDTELAEQETLIAELESGVNELPDKPYDMLQARVDETNSCRYLFYYYGGSNPDIAKDLNVSNVKTMYGMFQGCTNLKNINMDNWNLSQIETMYNAFYGSGLVSLDLRNKNLNNLTDITAMCSECKSLKSFFINPIYTRNAKNFTNLFYYNISLETINGIDLLNATNVHQIFYLCLSLKNLTVKNIKVTLSLSNSSSLTLDSLTNTIKELWNNTNNALGGTRTLTIGSANLNKLANVYVKLITITDEMRAEDEYIDNKAPFVQCESTDDGAMLITEYVTTVKNWKLA